MSILIKGMKLPKKCCDCILLPAEIDWDGQWECPITERIVHKYVEERKSKPPDCPLIEIPPHGRLIDASEMAIKFNCRDIDITTLKNLHECLMEIPTVIESEE